MVSLDKEYMTRDGRKVRLLCIDGPDEGYPVVGFVEGLEDTFRWRLGGAFFFGFGESKFDLIEVKPRVKKTLWINHHDNGGTTTWNSESKALVYSPQTTIARTKCEIDVEHGCGLGDANE